MQAFPPVVERRDFYGLFGNAFNLVITQGFLPRRLRATAIREGIETKKKKEYPYATVFFLMQVLKNGVACYHRSFK